MASVTGSQPARETEPHLMGVPVEELKRAFRLMYTSRAIDDRESREIRQLS